MAATRRVFVIGGGPAGLFASRLLALHNPRWEVTLFERLPPLETFGFGVGLSGGTLRAVRAADERMYDDLVNASFEYSTAEFRLPGGTVRIPGFHSGVSIGRAQLLRVLLKRAVEAGVKVRIGTSVTVEDMRGRADLVIAADGVSSSTRQGWHDEFGASVEAGRGRFIWCGSKTPLEGAVFAPVDTEYGLFVAHAYPYAANRSTVVIETDEQTWKRAGFADSAVGSNDSDSRAVRYLSSVFHELLRGGTLIGNKSQWSRFSTVRCDRWFHQNVVLLGDAAANAHPSLGSGTKLALEDAVALAHALSDGPALDEALAQYDEQRRPDVERLQDRARRSQLWWESIGSRLHLSPERLAIAYLTRAGVVSINDVLTSAPGLARAAAAQFAGVERSAVPDTDVARWVINAATGEHDTGRIQVTVDCTDPWGPAAGEIVERVRNARSAGNNVVELTGHTSRSALLDRLALAERIRAETRMLVHVAATKEHIDDVAGGLIAGRADLTSVTTQ